MAVNSGKNSEVQKLSKLYMFTLLQVIYLLLILQKKYLKFLDCSVNKKKTKPKQIMTLYTKIIIWNYEK